MSRICRHMDDHEWVFCEGDAKGGVAEGTYCQACGLNLEDAIEEHSMIDLDEEDVDE